MNYDDYLAEQRAKYDSIIASSDKSKSAYHLALQALEHGSGSASAAASLLLSLEYDYPMQIKHIMRFDSVNRAHAEILILACVGGDFEPSKWICALGHDGHKIMQEIEKKWRK